MKSHFLVAAFACAVAPHAFADTWECVEATDGHVYRASQSVPGDNCRLIKKAPQPPAIKPKSRDVRIEIGMTALDVIESSYWGLPDRINKHETANGISEQWVYADRGSYLYFENGKLTAIDTTR